MGAPLPAFAATKLLAATWFIATAKHIAATRSTYDLVHIHYDHRIWARLLTYLARHLKIPIVVSLNTELWVSNWCRWLVANKHCNLSRSIDRWAIGSTDCALALTWPDAVGWRSELHGESTRIQVIPDAIDPLLFQAPIDRKAEKSFRKKHQIPDHKKVVAYIGRIRVEKGWRDLPSITKEIAKSDAFMLVCGDGPDRRKLEKQLTDITARDTWSITGFLDPVEVRTALQIADVLVLPSRREAFGSVLLEAMASGVPAVAYAVGGIVEVVGTPNAIRLVPPNDQVALVQAILELIFNTRKREYLIARGLRRVEDFSMSQATEQTVRCYRSLLGLGLATPKEAEAS